MSHYLKQVAPTTHIPCRYERSPVARSSETQYAAPRIRTCVELSRFSPRPRSAHHQNALLSASCECSRLAAGMQRLNSASHCTAEGLRRSRRQCWD